ncbi:MULTISPECIES: MBOAT family O-acyltransferase [unclassified Bradyrhizobium]|uniref:MBOAT family O-acyltransferase n=1 Tax=unclassified Bradyrhizobium TaxID=2631580 RepID=UPI0028ED5C59|nr:MULTISPECIES: MBOAT family O-acyltransferase [unclassified Bradyrhizobium]
MQFNSLTFIFLFLPVVLAGYLLLRRTRFANLFILLASLYFYGSSTWWYLVPFFFTALLDFIIGQMIEGNENERYRKLLLIVSVVANLGLLSIFKYTGWLTADAAATLAPLGITVPVVALSLPPAISFYTFQSMSYTIDIYRREFKPYRNVVDYLSFVSFFPHLVAGPIMRARDLLPQLANIRPLPSFSKVSGALFMILFGLFQKTVLADNFGSLVELTQRTIVDGSMPPGMGLIFTYAFTFQIYCDFAAYSTIARGIGRLLGVELMRNFLTPYFSTNPSEFWTRWHISLSTWLRDYLYIPLGGNQHGHLKTLRNLMITMLLGGLWHGAGAFFIVWGAFHGLLLILYRLVPIDALLIKRLGRLGQVLSTIFFFHLVCIGWIFFRSTPSEFLPIIRSIATLPNAVLPPLVESWGWTPIGASRAIWHALTANWVLSVYGWGFALFAIPTLVTDAIAWRHDCEFADLFRSMPWWLQTLLITALFYGILFFARREANEFIYFAF